MFLRIGFNDICECKRKIIVDYSIGGVLGNKSCLWDDENENICNYVET